MKAFWLNKQNNKNLIVFFAGWSFDENPFKNIISKNYDVVIFYDYNNLEFQKDIDFSSYQNKIFIGWSMGVFVGCKLRKIFADFDYKIAINGTPAPVDNEYGIPVKIFELTLKHAQIGLKEKFYKNIFQTSEEYEKYTKNPVKRSIENRVSELESLYKYIKNNSIDYEKFYDYALISEFDKIIPPKNQINFHTKNSVPFKILPYGHHLFYNLSSWDEIVEICR